MKKLFSTLCCLLIFTLTLTPVYAMNESTITLHSKHAYLYDRETSIEYLDKKSEDRIYPASMTKILTTLTAIEKIDDIKKVVTVKQEDIDGLLAQQATTAGFNPGEKVTYEDLLYGALLPSGADACNSLARLTYGGTKQLVNAMNEKVNSLQLKNTHFVNPTGLHDENHYTTVKDMAKILDYALNNSRFKTIFEAKEYTDSKKKRKWSSSFVRAAGKLDVDSSHINGAKSGFTDEAQLTLASTMTYEGHHFILVTAKAHGQRSHKHVQDALTVYDYLSKNFKKFIIYKKDEIIHTFYVLKSFEGFYDETMPFNKSIIISNDINVDSLDILYEGKTIIEAPIGTKDVLGTIRVQYNNKDIYSFDVTLSNPIESSILASVIHYTIIGGVFAFCLLLLARKIYRIKRKNKRARK